jgi:hypothetical protein
MDENLKNMPMLTGKGLRVAEAQKPAEDAGVTKLP